MLILISWKNIGTIPAEMWLECEAYTQFGKKQLSLNSLDVEYYPQSLLLINIIFETEFTEWTKTSQMCDLAINFLS